MSFLPDAPAWGPIEYVTSIASGAVGGVVTFVAFVTGTRLRLTALERRSEKLEADAERAREVLARQPTREDIRADIARVEQIVSQGLDRIENRLNQMTPPRPHRAPRE